MIKFNMPRLTKAVEAKDYQEAEQAAHALKGIVNNLGFLPLADAAVDMLKELRDGNIDKALEAHQDIQRQYLRFTDAINK